MFEVDEIVEIIGVKYPENTHYIGMEAVITGPLQPLLSGEGYQVAVSGEIMHFCYQYLKKKDDPNSTVSWDEIEKEFGWNPKETVNG